MIKLSKHFPDAANDYLYLLDKGYPQKSILKLVGDKYQLIGVERSMLFRGIATRENCQLRLSKQINKIKKASALYIDGYNVIRTIGSYLTGKPVFISMDGFLRDAAEMHRSVLKEKVLNITLDLIFEYLTKSKISKATIYLDEPVSKSGELASALNDRLIKAGIDGLAKTVHSPDHHLKEVNEGIICTADSAIIDNTMTKVFDLTKAILVMNYQPDLIELNNLFPT